MIEYIQKHWTKKQKILLGINIYLLYFLLSLLLCVWLDLPATPIGY